MLVKKEKLLFTIPLILLFAFSLKAQSETNISTRAEGPSACDDNEARLNQTLNSLSNQNNPNDVLIIIARPGNGENSLEISRSRLYYAKQYILLKMPSSMDRIIFAVGEKRTGYGLIDFYVGGKLVERLFVPKNRTLCVDCCENYLIKPYKSARQVKRKTKRQ